MNEKIYARFEQRVRLTSGTMQGTGEQARIYRMCNMGTCTGWPILK